MNDDQFAKTKTIGLAIQALNNAVFEGSKIGVIVTLELETRNTYGRVPKDVKATYEFVDPSMPIEKPFE